MKHLAVVCCFGVTVAACDGEAGRRFPAPQPSPVVLPAPAPPPPAPESVPQIRVDEELEATLTGHGTHMRYEFRAPSNGLLAVQLTWDTTAGRLELWLQGRQFATSSPIIGTLTVTAGRKYEVRVEDGAPWDYDDLVVPFVLTASMR